MLLSETHAALLQDGSLSFRIPSWRRTRYVIAPWSRGFTAVCQRGPQSFPAIPWTVVAVPPTGAEPREPNAGVEAFLAGIPDKARHRVAPYQYGQCLLLSWLATRAEVRDLADSNPNLFWLLAVAVNERRITADQISGLCRMKQADILRVITGAGSKAQVRFLRKVRVAEGTMIGGRFLLEAAGNRAIVQTLRHWREIPVTLVRLLATYPLLAREQLIPVIAAKAAECEDVGPAHNRRLHQALGWLEEASCSWSARKFQERLEETMFDLCHEAERFQRYAAYALLDEICAESTAFPPPPLAGIKTIEPITTAEELNAERREQQHCVGQYANNVRAGHVYFYRVIAPQRATLEIVLTGDAPVLGELRLARNGRPGRAVIKAVREWFSAACLAAGKDVDHARACGGRANL